MMRSQYADLSARTYVEFTFCYRGEGVHRPPESGVSEGKKEEMQTVNGGRRQNGRKLN